MKLTIHRGSHQIGGSCVELASKSTRLIVDIGLPLPDVGGSSVDMHAVRRMSPDELVDSRAAPPVEGLYRGRPAVDAIFLSHAHQDHAGLLQKTQSHIPVYASSGTSKILLASEIFGSGQQISRDRFVRTRDGSQIEIGDFLVTPLAVDHSVCGSQAFLFEADGRSVLYSGDLRWHGARPETVTRLASFCSSRGIDVLLVEGTHIDGDEARTITEHALEHHVHEIMKNAPGLVVTYFSPTHVDRLAGFARAAKKANRCLVVDAYVATIMYLVRSETDVPSPTGNEDVRIFWQKTFRRRPRSKLHHKFENDRIELREVLENPRKFVMTFRTSMARDDFSGRFPPETTCIYSAWRGYLDTAPWQDVRGQIETAEGRFVVVHTGGHITAADLRRLVKRCRPKRVIPMHTESPERFSALFSDVVVLDDGEEYDVG